MFSRFWAASAALLALAPLCASIPANAKYLPHSDAVHAEAESRQIGTTPLRTWTHDYSYKGTNYTWTMVGTDPAAGSATTIVPAYIIPLVFSLPNGTVLDPRKPGQKYTMTPLQVTLASPIFKKFWFTNGAVNLGTTQFIDAFQRGNFWSQVSSVAPNYHVLLGKPTILPAIKIALKTSSGVFKGPHGVAAAIVPTAVVEQAMLNYIKTTPAIATNGFPIFLSYNVSTQDASGGACGYHANVGRQTYTFTMFDDNNVCGAIDGDVETLTHEVAEWVNDPFGRNTTPDNFGILEVGDPVQNFGFYMPSTTFTFTLEDLTFHSWFTCTTPSGSVNGYYDYMGIFKRPDC